MFSGRYQSRVILLFVAITAQFCTGFDFQCDFDTDNCGFRQITSWGNTGLYGDHKDWSRQKVTDPVRESGPARDHTTGSGYYWVYDIWDFSSFNARAITYKEITVTKSNTWLRFWYHMYDKVGMGMGYLKVYAGSNLIFSKSGNQGNGWKLAEVKLDFVGQRRFSFLGFKSGSQYGNIAIDDMVVAEYWKPNVTSLTVVKTGVCLNMNVELNCTSNGYPPSEYSFYVNDQFVRKSFNGIQNIRTTVLGNATYRCEPSNSMGAGENATIEITTLPLPTVKVPSVAVVEGSTLNLFCNATGNGPFQYVWKIGSRNNIILPPSSENNYTKPGITRSFYDDYSCLATDRNGCSRESSPKTAVDIQYPPRTPTVYLGKPSVCLYDTARVGCYTSANPRTHDVVVESDGQIIATQRTQYFVYLYFNSTREGTHTYACKVNNSVGIAPIASKIMVTKAPPKITQITANQTVHEGSRLVLECNTSGSEPMTVTWRKVGGSAFPSGSNITFESLTTADQGLYECTASNGAECPATSSQTYVHVLYKPRATNMTVSNNTICLNRLVQFHCTANADPPVTNYSLYLNDQLIKSSSSPTIQIKSVTEGNNTYRCQPGNAVGLGENATVYMNTKAPPNITWLPPNQSIPEGSKVLFPCNVTGSDPMNIVWKKIGINSPIPGGHVLGFNALMRSHDGGYECSASNGDECPSASSSTFINVLYQPAITTSPRSSLTLYENGTISLNCKAHGNPAANITWKREGAVVGYGENLGLTKEQSAQGVYTCVAGNGIGVDAKANTNVVVKICENVCQSNSTCIRQGSTWSCDCRRGFKGRYCEKDDPIAKKFSIKIVILVPVWKDEYLDSSSNDFKDLEKEICKAIKKVFFRTLINCKLITASKGSINTETELEFNATKTETEVEGALSGASANGTLGSLTLDPSASFQTSAKDNICETKPCLYEGTCTAQGDGFSCDCKLFRFGNHCEKGVGLGAGITIIIVAILLLVVNIAVIIYFCCLVKKKGYGTDSAKEKEIRMHQYKLKNDSRASSAYNKGFDEKEAERSRLSIEKPAIA